MINENDLLDQTKALSLTDQIKQDEQVRGSQDNVGVPDEMKVPVKIDEVTGTPLPSDSFVAQGEVDKYNKLREAKAKADAISKAAAAASAPVGGAGMSDASMAALRGTAQAKEFTQAQSFQTQATRPGSAATPYNVPAGQGIVQNVPGTISTTIRGTPEEILRQIDAERAIKQRQIQDQVEKITQADEKNEAAQRSAPAQDTRSERVKVLGSAIPQGGILKQMANAAIVSGITNPSSRALALSQNADVVASIGKAADVMAGKSNNGLTSDDIENIDKANKLGRSGFNPPQYKVFQEKMALLKKAVVDSYTQPMRDLNTKVTSNPSMTVVEWNKLQDETVASLTAGTGGTLDPLQAKAMVESIKPLEVRRHEMEVQRNESVFRDKITEQKAKENRIEPSQVDRGAIDTMVAQAKAGAGEGYDAYKRMENGRTAGWVRVTGPKLATETVVQQTVAEATAEKTGFTQVPKYSVDADGNVRVIQAPRKKGVSYTPRIEQGGTVTVSSDTRPVLVKGGASEGSVNSEPVVAKYIEKMDAEVNSNPQHDLSTLTPGLVPSVGASIAKQIQSGKVKVTDEESMGRAIEAGIDEFSTGRKQKFIASKVDKIGIAKEAHDILQKELVDANNKAAEESEAEIAAFNRNLVKYDANGNPAINNSIVPSLSDQDVNSAANAYLHDKPTGGYDPTTTALDIFRNKVTGLAGAKGGLTDRYAQAGIAAIEASVGLEKQPVNDEYKDFKIAFDKILEDQNKVSNAIANIRGKEVVDLTPLNPSLAEFLKDNPDVLRASIKDPHNPANRIAYIHGNLEPEVENIVRNSKMSYEDVYPLLGGGVFKTKAGRIITGLSTIGDEVMTPEGKLTPRGKAIVYSLSGNAQGLVDEKLINDGSTTIKEMDKQIDDTLGKALVKVDNKKPEFFPTAGIPENLKSNNRDLYAKGMAYASRSEFATARKIMRTALMLQRIDDAYIAATMAVNTVARTANTVKTFAAQAGMKDGEMAGKDDVKVIAEATFRALQNKSQYAPSKQLYAVEDAISANQANIEYLKSASYAGSSGKAGSEELRKAMAVQSALEQSKSMLEQWKSGALEDVSPVARIIKDITEANKNSKIVIEGVDIPFIKPGRTTEKRLAQVRTDYKQLEAETTDYFRTHPYNRYGKKSQEFQRAYINMRKEEAKLLVSEDEFAKHASK